MLPDIPGIPNLRNFLPRLPNMGIANQALSQEQEVEALPEWQRLFLAGAPEVDVERAKQYEGLYGQAGLRNVAAGLGEAPPEQRRGLLESFADYATRLQSATTGFVTGLAGLERRRETFGTGVESGELFDRPEPAQAGLGLALERFAQGLSGEEKFQAADFGALAYDRETAGTGERFLKSAVGFVLDTALDPLTYVSFGGSVLGRRLGAQAVNRVARKNASNLIGTLDDAAKATTIKQGVLKMGIDDSILTNTVRQVRPDLAPATGLMNTDDAIAALAQVPGALDDMAMDAMAATSAGMYRAFGPGGLFRYLSEEFSDAGVQFWRQLPADIKGGMRMRVPFSGLYRRATGQVGELGGALPAALRVPGTGTGAISRTLKTEKVTNGFRSWMRNKRLLRGASNELNGATGASNMATAEAIYKRNKDWMRNITGEFDPKVDEKLRAVSWKATDELEQGLSALRAGALQKMDEILPALQAGTKAYQQGIAQSREEFLDLMDVAIKADVQKFGGDAQTIEEVFGIAGREATELEQLAYDAAGNYQYLLRDIESQMQGLENHYAGFAPNFIENYWPRIMDDIEESMKGRMSAAGFGNLRARTHFVAEFNPDGTVARWMTPREIAAQLGEDLFMQDADKLMNTYVVSMNKFLQEERFFQQMLDRGVLFRGGAEAMAVVKDVSAASEAWIEGYNALLSGRRALRELGVGRQGDVLDASRATGKELDLAVARAQDVATALNAGRRHGAKLLGQYRQVSDGVWRAADGTTIRMVMEQGYPLYVLSRRVGDAEQYWTVASRWSNDANKANPFMSPEDAMAAADLAMVTERKRMFVEQIEELRVEFLKDVARAIQTRKNLNNAGLNPLEPGNIPPANQEQFFSSIADVINKYGSDAGLQSRRILAKAYKEGQGFGAGRGAAFAPAMGGQDGPQVRAFWANRMQRLGIFGAETLVDDVKRIFAARQKPEGLKKWINDWYVPFYAAQKSMMTVQRGPGYVLRNISGGMWNAYLIGTTARHWRLASAAKISEMQAIAHAKKEAPDDFLLQGRLFREKFREIMVSRLGERRGNRVADAWFTFEKRGLRGRSTASQSRGIRSVDASATAALRRELDADEMNMYERGLQKVSDDWWWARRMSAAAENSEDYLRFGAFLRGVDLYGLDDGGRAAAMMVKASQFDYSDLSQFEAETVKMLVPFYTWTRNNVPLQFRAMVHEPGKIMRAIRINDALADAFGEEDLPEEPMPSYVRERFGWRVRKDLWSGPMGDAISAGMVIGEPLVDVNRLFGSARSTGVVAGPTSMLNWRELANQLNPVFGIGAETLTGIERSTGGRMPLQEDVPPWLRWTGVGRAAGEDIPQISARGLRFAREILPPLGMVERYAAPLLGNERLQRRWYTTLASAIFGLPVSTLDPYQTGAELRAQQQRLESGLRRKFGANLSTYTGYVNRALQEGATPEEMQVVIRDGLLGGRDIADVPPEELDETAMVDTLRFMRRMMQMEAQGVPRETINLMLDFFEPRTDAERGVRSGKTPPLTPEQLSTLGETPTSVANMSPEERLEVLRRWIRENPDWGTALP